MSEKTAPAEVDSNASGHHPHRRARDSLTAMTRLRAQIDRELAGCGLGPPLTSTLRGQARQRRRSQKRTAGSAGNI